MRQQLQTYNQGLDEEWSDQNWIQIFPKRDTFDKKWNKIFLAN